MSPMDGVVVPTLENREAHEPNKRDATHARWPLALVQELADRRCVIVIGAGLSATARSANDGSLRPPGWQSLIEGLRDDCLQNVDAEEVNSDISSNNLLAAVEKLQSLANSQDLDHALRSRLVTPNFRPSQAHEAVIKLDQQVVVSLNFDTIYEDLCKKGDASQYSVIHASDNRLAKSVRSSRNIVYKMHGDAGLPGSAVFGVTDYIRRATESPNDDKVLRALFLTRTVLFIGCGMASDPDLDLLITRADSDLTEPYGHYCLTHAANRSRVLAKGRQGLLIPIEYGPEDSPTSHDAFTPSLEALARLVIDARSRGV